MIALALAPVAVAQDQADGFSAQNWRPPIDARTSLWTERTTSYEDLIATGQALLSYTNSPLVYQAATGDETRLISSVWQADLAAGLHLGRIRFGVLAPIVLTSEGDAVTTGSGFGDLALDGKINLFRDGVGPLGLAVAGRALLPTGTVDAPLTNRNAGWEVVGLVDKQISHVVLAANVGLRGAPEVALENIDLNDQMFYRGAVSYLFDATPRAGLSLDVAGQLNLPGLGTAAAGAPIEGLVGAWTCVGETWSVRGGLGTGNSGIGAAGFRAMLGVGFAPGTECGPADEPAPQPQLRVSVVTPDGQPVPGVTSALTVDGMPISAANELTTSVDPGTYAFRATAPGYTPLAVDIAVPPGAEHQEVLTMVPAPCAVTVQLVDLAGNPLTGEWSADQKTWSPIVGGQATAQLPMGAYTLYGRSPEFQDGTEKIEVQPGKDNTAVIELGKRTVQTDDTIDLKEVVQFDTNSAKIKSVSFPLLDEVAAIMIRHPEILKIRVEGHTDNRGDAAYNQGLSQRRAASVVLYLQKKGVEGTRMSSAGYGEERPIATNDTPEGQFQNRRVTIVIEERAKK